MEVYFYILGLYLYIRVDKCLRVQQCKLLSMAPRGMVIWKLHNQGAPLLWSGVWCNPILPRYWSNGYFLLGFFCWIHLTERMIPKTRLTVVTSRVARRHHADFLKQLLIWDVDGDPGVCVWINCSRKYGSNMYSKLWWH